MKLPFLDRDRAFSSGEGWGKFVGPFFHRGLLLLDGDEHRHHRRIVQHAFLPSRISAYVERMTPATTRDLASWPADGMFEACLRASNSPLRVAAPGLAWSRGIAARRRLEEIFGAWVAERRASDGPADGLPIRLRGRDRSHGIASAH